MAVSLSAAVILSAQFPTAAQVAASGLADPAHAVLVAGKATSAPTTYAGFTSPQTGGLSAMQRYSAQYAANQGAVQGEYWFDLTGVVVAGDHVWFGVFGYGGGIPSSGDVPLAVAGPFTVEA